MTETPAVNERTEPTRGADATELALRLVEETTRRQQAEALAETATATADAETARATLVDLRATAVQSIASVQARDRAERMAAMHQGLLALRSDLDGLRAAAEAAIADGALATGTVARPTAVAPLAPVASSQVPAALSQVPAANQAPAASPVARLAPDLAKSAQELLARGRLDVADDVIRGLEDAAARLRAQTPPPADG